MKKATKLLGIVLIIALVMSMGIASAFAAGEYQITIENTNSNMSIAGKTYSAYKVFDLTLGNPTTTGTGASAVTTYGAYAYSIKNTDWAWATLTDEATTASDGKITTKYGIILTPSAADPNLYYVDKATMTDTDARALADKLAKTTLPTAAGTVAVPANAQTATIEMDEPGYYAVFGVVYSTDPYYTTSNPAPEVVAAVALTTTDPTVKINPKATVPPLDKKITGVSEGTQVINGAVLDTAGQAAVAKVGSVVNFQVDSLTPDLTGYDDYTYIIGDAISAGLTYNKSSFTLKIGDDTVYQNGAVVTGHNITLAFGTDDKSFDLTIPFAELSKYVAGKDVVLTYSCTVNSEAVKYDRENNTASLEYSKTPYNNETNHTPEKETYVIDLNIDVDKVAENASGKKLSGAEFKLYRMNGTAKEYYKWANNVVTWVNTQAAGDTFKTDANGKLETQIQGLDKGDYYLEETKAPEGYNLLAAPVKVTITVTESEENGTKTVTYTASTDGANIAVNNASVNLGPNQIEAQPVAVATIVNKTGTVLPSTGGIGTTIFYVVGSIMVVAAGVLLITKKRMGREG